MSYPQGYSQVWNYAGVIPVNGSLGAARPEARGRRRTAYFQRVVSAKPAMMNAKPTPRFQAPSAGIGSCADPLR